jgi:hypothetical protein
MSCTQQNFPEIDQRNFKTGHQEQTIGLVPTEFLKSWRVVSTFCGEYCP